MSIPRRGPLGHPRAKPSLDMPRTDSLEHPRGSPAASQCRFSSTDTPGQGGHCSPHDLGSLRRPGSRGRGTQPLRRSHCPGVGLGMLSGPCSSPSGTRFAFLPLTLGQQQQQRGCVQFVSLVPFCPADAFCNLGRVTRAPPRASASPSSPSAANWGGQLGQLPLLQSLRRVPARNKAASGTRGMREVTLVPSRAASLCQGRGC